MKRAAVIGAGEIGAGWAALFAAHGADVAVVDPDPEALTRANDALRAAQSLGLGHGRPGGFTASRDLDGAIQGVEWIQEATPEALELKQSLFAQVESLASPEAVIASSTSSFTRAQLSQGMRDVSRLVIVHPLQPVYAVAIVEVNVDDSLPKYVIARLLETLRELGREPILVRGDLPGLVANRLTAALLREALDLISRGVVDAGDLDRVVARGLATGWVARGPLATEAIGARLDTGERLPEALDTTLAPLWKSLASWEALDTQARAAVTRALRDSLGPMQKTHASGESAWAKTLSRVARAAEAD